MAADKKYDRHYFEPGSPQDEKISPWTHSPSSWLRKRVMIEEGNDKEGDLPTSTTATITAATVKGGSRREVHEDDVEEFMRIMRYAFISKSPASSSSSSQGEEEEERGDENNSGTEGGLSLLAPEEKEGAPEETCYPQAPLPFPLSL